MATQKQIDAQVKQGRIKSAKIAKAVAKDHKGYSIDKVGAITNAMVNKGKSKKKAAKSKRRSARR